MINRTQCMHMLYALMLTSIALVGLVSIASAQELDTSALLGEESYTGVEASPVGTFLFYVLLTLWGLLVTYYLVVKRNILGTYVPSHTTVYEDASIDTQEPVVAEYVAVTTSDAPINLPTQSQALSYVSHEEDTDDLQDLENQAHQQRVLLSSDAMRYFTAKVQNVEDRSSVLATILQKAHISFPSEDGWVVINLSRMEELLASANETIHDTAITDSQVTVENMDSPMPAGSLAEAMVLGNLATAYALIAHRPMIALADAASDLDALYRARNGELTSVSALLSSSTKMLTDVQIKEAIQALTGALDGTYTDEASAVKMAIMKAVKALAK